MTTLLDEQLLKKYNRAAGTGFHTQDDVLAGLRAVADAAVAADRATGEVGLTDAPEGYALMEKSRLQKALLEAFIGLMQGLVTQLEMLEKIKELEETVAAHEAKNKSEVQHEQA